MHTVNQLYSGTTLVIILYKYNMGTPVIAMFPCRIGTTPSVYILRRVKEKARP